MLNAIQELEKVVKDKSSEEKKMLKAIKELENVGIAMSCKVIFLEDEVIKIKEDSKNNKDINLEEPFKDASEFQISTPVSEKQKLPDVENKYVESKKNEIKCEKCEYTCQEQSTLTKHINTKHKDQKCKVCLMKLGSTMQHIAKEHSGIEEHNIKEENRIERIEIKDADKIKLIKTNEDTKRVDIEEKDTSFVFSESRFFDELL